MIGTTSRTGTAGRVTLAGALLLAAGCLAGAQERPPTDAPAPHRHREGSAPAPDGDALRAAAFDPARLRARRRALVEALPDGAVVVVAGPERTSDTHPYWASPNVLYLSGVREPGLSILLTADDDVLFAPPRDAGYERWNGARVSVGSPLADAVGFGDVVLRQQRAERVAQALEEQGGPLYLDGVSLEELGLPDTTSTRALGGALGALRQVKDPTEVALIERAAAITGAALREAAASVRPGLREYELQAVIEYVFLRYGAQRPGFASIVGSGPNSCVLHYSANRRVVEAGDLVVCDVGAELWGYTADVTRTLPVSGAFTDRQREVYEAVLRAQAAGIAAVRPGVTLRDVDRAARESLAEAGLAEHFLHGTSHWLGLDVHDVGSYGRALQPGMVLTVEPGVYLPDEAIGVRIEDDVLVTEDGARVLSDGVPRTVEAIEALVRQDGAGARPVAPLHAPAPGAAPPGTGR